MIVIGRDDRGRESWLNGSPGFEYSEWFHRAVRRFCDFVSGRWRMALHVLRLRKTTQKFSQQGRKCLAKFVVSSSTDSPWVAASGHSGQPRCKFFRVAELVLDKILGPCFQR
jgi:hypothetical protein